jgi:hypothetical protein
MGDHATQSLETQVHDARAALMKAASTDPERWWTADDLRDRVQNGWPATVVNVALNDLVSSHQLTLNPRFHIRVEH